MDKRPNKVSILILTMNEEVNIGACLEGVKWADEIFVLDSGSTDGTLAICREYTANLYSRKFDNWSSQLNWALSALPFRNEWLFNVDADEIVSDALAAEIIVAAESSPDSVTTWWLRRRFIFLGKWLRYSALYKSWILRMFRHKRVRFQRLVNPVPVYEGESAYFANDLIHNDRKGFAALVARHNSYSSYEAVESLRRLYPQYLTDAERASTLRDDSALKKKKLLFERLPLFARPPARFAYMYLFNLGFLDGLPGFIYSFFKLCYEFFICVKIYELKCMRASSHADAAPLKERNANAIGSRELQDGKA
jgi:glycosyltransferase involved in cell wall biosynthesis